MNASIAPVFARLFAIVLGICGVLALSGCAADPKNMAMGSSATQVLASLGTPTADFSTPTGRRIQYSRQPLGQQVFNVDLNSAGQVTTITQALAMPVFAKVEVNAWRAAQVQAEFGKPAYIDKVRSFNGDVWNYRFNDLDGVDKQFHVFLDASGLVKATQVTVEVERMRDDK
jgi:outer membrane protein assembly factor BamE (lipoprotein component of BamABCDE complex)